MKLPSKKAIWEALKEVLRLMLFAALAALSGWLANLVAGLDPNSVYYIALTLFLRFLDKYIHEHKDVKAKGIVPF